MNRAVAMALWVGIVLCARAQAVGLRSSALLTNGQRGEGTVDTVGRHLEKISVFAYHITEDGDVLPPSAWVPDVLDRLMSDPRGHLILVTVNNRVLGPDGKLTPFHGGDTVKEILSDPEKRSEHIRQLAELSRQAHGIELNYERFSPDMRDLFTDFVRDLRAAMPRGRKLSLVLQPKTNGANGSNGYAVDWRAVEPYADYMRIMAYYYSWSTSRHGPVAPMAILESLGKYALGDPDQRIPRHKVSIILSLWGWDWPMPEGTPGTLIQLARAREIAASHGVTPKRDPEEMSLNFLYTAGDGGTHEVWIDDFESIRARVELLQSLGMPRVDFWHLNTGDPPLWDFVAAETARVRRSGLDFDGDRLSDLAVFRPDGARWFVDTSHDGGTDLVRSYGKGSDVPVPADYDGDGAVDLAVFRASQGGWLVDLDGDGVSDRSATLGKSGDVPVPADYDGDGAADFAVFDPSAASWLVDSDFDGVPDVSPVYGMDGDVPT
ncbi:MAG: glycosyl hydrolase family 18 protein, partial [Candidatus Binatia bacterium]